MLASLVLTFLQSAQGSAVASDANWPSFRGEQARGVAEDHATPVAWSVAAGTNVRWKTPIPGLSHSSPVVWKGRIFVTTAVRQAGDQVLKVGQYGSPTSVEDEGVHKFQVYCLDRRNGDVIWVRTAIERTPAQKRHPKGSHAAPSPATDGKHVVAFFASEGMYCYDADGQLLWTKDFGVLDSSWYVASGAQFGFSSSPVIFEDKVIVQCDVLGESFLCALNVADGSERWRTARADVPTWSTPTVTLAGGRRQVVVNGYKHMGGYDLDTGAELWKLGGGGDVPVPTPIVDGNRIFITNGHGRWNPIYAIDANARGEIANGFDPDAEQYVFWSQQRRGNYLQTPIFYRDRLYACTDAGIITCIDPQTGEHLARQRIGEGGSGFTASPVAADGKLYYTSEDGDVYVLKAGPGLETLAVNPMGENCMATPAIAGGVIYIRTRSQIVAVAGDEPVTAPAETSAAAREPEPTPAPPAKTFDPASLPDATSLIDKHIAARGGAGAFRKHSSVSMRAKFTMPSIGLTADIETRFLAPHHHLAVTDMPGMGVTRQGFNGDIGWVMSPMAGTAILSAGQLEAARVEGDPTSDLGLAERYPSRQTVDQAEFHGHTCWVVHAKDRHDRDAKLYFDVDSGFLTGMDATSDTAAGLLRIISVLDDYRDHAGLQIAMKTKAIIPEHDIEQVVTVEAISFDPVPPETFEPPDEIKKLRDKR